MTYLTRSSVESPADAQLVASKQRGLALLSPTRAAAYWSGQEKERTRIVIEIRDGKLVVRERGSRLPRRPLNGSQLRQIAAWLGTEIDVVLYQNKIAMAPYTHLQESIDALRGEFLRFRIQGWWNQDERGVLETAVLRSLKDPRWRFRTIAGIASELHLSEADVRGSIMRLGNAVRQPLVEDGSGRELYTAASRKPSWRERYLELRERLAIW